MLAAGFAPAQDQPDPGARGQQEPTYEGPSVLSRPSGFGTYAQGAGASNFGDFPADSEQPNASAAPPNQDGPSILSRDDSSSQETKVAPNATGLYAQIIGLYDSGLAAPVSQQSKQAPAGSYGQEINFGANASHRWRHGSLKVEYRGSYRQYNNAPAFDGLDQLLQITYHEAPIRHLTLDIKSTIGTTTLANGAFSYFPLASVDRLGIPSGELFDNRTNYVQSRMDLTWRLTPRLSLGFGGDGFVVRRESLLLAGLNGYSARSSVAYRLTARQTISANYDNTYFDFQDAFGNSRLETTALGYSITLTKKWDVSTLAGAVRVNALGLTQVALDPAVTALTGVSFAFVTFSNVLYLPVAEVRSIRRFKEASLIIDFARGVTPGNGLYLTSRQTSGAVAYSYKATRALQVRANASYSRLSALAAVAGQALGTYSNLQGGIQAVYRLRRDTYLDLRYDYRHYTTGAAILEMDSNRVSLGIVFGLGATSAMAW